MAYKKPTAGQQSWASVLNKQLEQLSPDDGGGINYFDDWTKRPTTKVGSPVGLDKDDDGLTYLNT
jgi:hypothetical protein